MLEGSFVPVMKTIASPNAKQPKIMAHCKMTFFMVAFYDENIKAHVPKDETLET